MTHEEHTMPTLATIEKTNGTKIKKYEPFFEEPFAEFAALRRAMMRSFFDPLTVFEPSSLDFAPALNLYEKDGAYTLECALPGYRKEDIKVETSGDSVTISGSYAHEQAEEKAHYHRKEVRRGSFSRTIALPQEVDADKVAATLENGMLTVTLRTSKAIHSKSIPISAG
jgi:HSP20 family molecular chaperone IbpA